MIILPSAGAVLLMAGVPADTEATAKPAPAGIEAVHPAAGPSAPDTPAPLAPVEASPQDDQAPPADMSLPLADVPVPEGDIVVTARGDAPPGDPLQGVNIQSFEIVQSIDEAVVGPIAHGYRTILPEPVRDGLGNALRNLGEPVNFLNFLLQFKLGKAAETLGRFAVNSTLGLGGLFDVAKKKPFNLPHRPNGFANTLGYYGVESGPYLYLPLVGSTTLRDLFGDTVDILILPTSVGKPFDRATFALPATAINKLNERVARDSEIRRLREESIDPYAETRTLYLDMRQREIDSLKGVGHGGDVPAAGAPGIEAPTAAVQPGQDAPVAEEVDPAPL
ncbi:MlaA family lipoprotein [Sphingopyxis sp. LARHCG72]